MREADIEELEQLNQKLHLMIIEARKDAEMWKDLFYKAIEKMDSKVLKSFPLNNK